MLWPTFSRSGANSRKDAVELVVDFAKQDYPKKKKKKSGIHNAIPDEFDDSFEQENCEFLKRVLPISLIFNG